MNVEMHSKYPVLHPQVAARVVDEEAVIVLADSGEVGVLNAVGTRVWELIDGLRSVRDIAEAIAAEYERAADQVLPDVDAFMQQLVQAQAIVLHESPVRDKIEPN